MFANFVETRTWLQKFAGAFGRPLLGSLRDLLPIIVTVTVFQLFVFRQPLDDVPVLLAGLVFVLFGLTFFIIGLDMGLFPLGEQLAKDLAKKGSLPWLLIFAFSLGFGTTFAEPALISIAEKAGELQYGTASNATDAGANSNEAWKFAMLLRIVVAFAVGTALVVGVLRIIKGWPLHYIIIVGYGVVSLITPFVPASMVAIAYDSGGVTTSTITVPLTTALGVGLASCIRGRNPLFDGFGLIAFASLFPIIFVLLMGLMFPPAATSTIDPTVVEHHSVSMWWQLVGSFGGTIRDVLPIAIIVIVFQLLVLRKMIHNLPKVLWGFLFVLLGLSLFLVGLKIALFPLGESMAKQLTLGSFLGIEMGEELIPSVSTLPWYRFYWTFLFAFFVGFSTSIAEPALIAVAQKSEVVSGGAVRADALRIVVSVGVGVGVALGTLRIVLGVPLPYFILAGYFIVMCQTAFAPRDIIPLAYDSGGVCTSTVTVPIVAALGLGLAYELGGNPLVDGFGMIAFAVLFPMITVMGYAQFGRWWENRQQKRSVESDSHAPGHDT